MNFKLTRIIEGWFAWKKTRPTFRHMRYYCLSGLLFLLLLLRQGDLGAFTLNMAGGPPAITNQPQDQLVSVGSDVTFKVELDISPTFFTYRWFHNRTRIEGADGPMLMLFDVNLSDVGTYFVEVDNAGGTTPSSNAVLSLRLVQDFIPMEPGNSGTRMLTGETVPPEPGDCMMVNDSTQWLGLAPTADGVCVIDTTGSPGDTFLQVYEGDEWPYVNFIACDDNSAPDNVSGRVQFPARQGLHYLVAVNFQDPPDPAGPAVVNWSFGIPPKVIVDPTNQTAKLGEDVVFRVVAEGVPAPIYQWHKDGLALPQTNDTLVLTGVGTNDVGLYQVDLRNDFGSTLSMAAELSIPPVARLQALGMLTNGFLFFIQGPTGVYDLQYTLDYAGWNYLTTTNVPEGGLEVIDEQALKFPQRSYRAAPR